MRYINIAGRCVVQIEPSMTTLTTEFLHHLQDDNGGLPVVGRVTTDVSLICPTDTVMLLDHRLFTDHRLLFVSEGGVIVKMELTEHTFVLTIKGSDCADVLPVLVQTMLNFYMPQYGLVFLHTAACLTDSGVVAIHGFGGAGKTEVMLELLTRGARYLSDDLAIFDAEGRLYPYLRRIALHDYPYTDAQLRQYGLSRRLYRLMTHCKGKTDRLRNYLYRRLRGRFNISLDYTVVTGSEDASVEKSYDVNRHYWLDASNQTATCSMQKDTFVRKMTFCMQNEFRPYIDFDGYCSVIFPFWHTLQNKHSEVLGKVLDSIDIHGVTICSQQYDEVAELILKQNSR